MIDPILYAKITYALGWTNILGLLLVFFSCRCMLGKQNRFLQKMTQSEFYSKFYGFHCYYWYFLIASILLHAFFAVTAFGIPFFK